MDDGPVPQDSSRTPPTPLAGVRICLVFEYNLSHHTRYLREIRALQEAGADVRLLTTHRKPENAPPGMHVTVAPLKSRLEKRIGKSAMRNPLARRIDNRLRRLARSAAKRVSPKPTTVLRDRALRSLRSTVDIFWVSDYLSLPTVIEATRDVDTRVVYETVDLVPEYLQHGARHRDTLLAGEREIIGQVDGFITACDSYADYYMESYGEILKRRPTVCDNIPEVRMPAVTPSSRPVRILFFGQLMHDRPVIELIEAIALCHEDVMLTFQGTNHLGAGPMARIVELGLQDRVTLLDPCPPETIVETAAEYDVGIVALRGIDENERRASTSKLFTYMFAGLAVIGSDLPGIARVVDEWDNGILVEDMMPVTWARAIDRLAAMPRTEIDAMKQRSLSGSEHYAWERQKPLFIAEFQRALGRVAPEAIVSGAVMPDPDRDGPTESVEAPAPSEADHPDGDVSRRSRSDSRRWVEAGPAGADRFTMLLDPASAGHGAAQMATGTYDRTFLDALRPHAALRGAVIWDVGAHIGYESLCFAGLVGPTGRVIAFEPNPANIEEWRRNVSDNPGLASRMVLRCEALSDRSGVATFRASDEVADGRSSGSHLTDVLPPEPELSYAGFAELSVDCVRVDDLVASGEVAPPTHMKIDVEGAEAAVLLGALETLGDRQPTLLIEVHHVRAMQQVDEILRGAGYSISLLDSDEESPSRCFLMAVPGSR